jgi:hypothetical protein
MTDDELAVLLRDCPTLYHMAERGGWASIQRHGLLSTSTLLERWEIVAHRRKAIEKTRRQESVVIDHPTLGRAVLRDQKPMDDTSLERCLRDGLTPPDWYGLLNARVFFWLTRERLHRLLKAKHYRVLEHDVLEIDTAELVAAYRKRITLSPINSGSTKPFGRSRGRDTFLSIADYPYAHWRERRDRSECVVELCVLGGVPDIARFTRRVVVMRGEEQLGVAFEHPYASQGIK